MSLNRQEKAVVIEEVSVEVAKAQSIVIAEYRGLDVASVTVLRKTARESGVYLRVLKNTLVRRAAAFRSDHHSGLFQLDTGLPAHALVQSAAQRRVARRAHWREQFL